MTVALCLSGGGAKGDFELGAIRCLYDRGIRPDVLASTSVGSINASKLAEGEDVADPERGLPGLEALWEQMHTRTDLCVDAGWLHDPDMDGRLRNLLTGRTSSLGVTGPDALAATWGLFSFVVDLTFLFGDGASLLKSLSLFTTKAHSLFELTPIKDKLASQLNLEHVTHWVSNGGRWRIAMVALDSGRLRYVTETGQVVERDGTPATWAGPLSPACQQLANAVTADEANVRILQSQLPSAGSGKAQLIVQIREAQQKWADDRARLTSCVAAQPAVPLTTDLRTAVLASASMPAIFASVPIGDESYVDGGVREILPVQAAVDLGADQIYAVSASAIDPEPLPPHSYADALVVEVAGRALMDIALNEIDLGDIHPSMPAGTAAPKVHLIAPDIDIHDVLVVDPGLVQINRDYGWMRAADVLDGVAVGSDRWRSATDIARVRLGTWRAENRRFGHNDPTQPPPGDQNPDNEPPADPNAQKTVDAGKSALADMLARRGQLGGPMPANIDRWTTSLELHPWSLDVNDAAFVDQQVPATIVKSQPAQVSVTMRNTGTTTWSEASGHRLGSQSPQDNTIWGADRQTLPTPVPPGGQATFSFSISAPPTPGTTFQWRMVQENVQWFGATTPAVFIAPFVSPQCANIDHQIQTTEAAIANLQQQLRHAAGSEKAFIVQEIRDDQNQLAELRQQRTTLGCP